MVNLPCRYYVPYFECRDSSPRLLIFANSWLVLTADDISNKERMSNVLHVWYCDELEERFIPSKLIVCKIGITHDVTTYYIHRNAAIIIQRKYRRYRQRSRALSILNPAVMHWAWKPDGPLMNLLRKKYCKSKCFNT